MGVSKQELCYTVETVESFLKSRFQNRPTLRWNVVYHRI